jgi:uracil-DNA glycosylase family protein
MFFVGEQPGDQEDRRGLPFIGPAGRLLDEALARAGVDRRAIYLTNAVQHFKWVPSEGGGKRRLHQKPNTTEVLACRPWLEAEIAAVVPRVIVCLGATAAQSLLGRGFRVTQHRGEAVPSPFGPPVVATVHPAAILRAPSETRAREMDHLIADLRSAAAMTRDAAPEAVSLGGAGAR